MLRQRRTVRLSRPTSMVFCYVCLSVFLRETTSYEEITENSIRGRTTQASMDRTQLRSIRTERRRLFCRRKANPDKGMEWADAVALQDNAHTEEKEVTNSSEKRQLALRLGERSTSQRKNIRQGHVSPRASDTHNRNTIAVRLKIGQKESYRSPWGPNVLGSPAGARPSGTQGHRIRRSDASIDEWTLEDLFSDAVIFSERALDSELKKSMAGVGDETANDDLNFDADEEAMEAAEEENLEKRDTNEVAITKTLMKDLEDKIYSRALAYIEENHLEPIPSLVTTTQPTFEKSVTPANASNALDANQTIALDANQTIALDANQTIASNATISEMPNVGNETSTEIRKSKKKKKKKGSRMKSRRRKGKRKKKKKLGALEKRRRKNMKKSKGKKSKGKKAKKYNKKNKKTGALTRENKYRTKKQKKKKKRHEVQKKEKNKKKGALTEKNNNRTKEKKTSKRNDIKTEKKLRRIPEKKNMKGKETSKAMKNKKKDRENTKKENMNTKKTKEVKKKEKNRKSSSTEKTKHKPKNKVLSKKWRRKEAKSTERKKASSTKKERKKVVSSAVKKAQKSQRNEKHEQRRIRRK